MLFSTEYKKSFQSARKLFRLYGNFSKCLKIFQTIWKVLRVTINFPDFLESLPESFHFSDNCFGTAFYKKKFDEKTFWVAQLPRYFSLFKRGRQIMNFDLQNLFCKVHKGFKRCSHIPKLSLERSGQLIFP